MLLQSSALRTERREDFVLFGETTCLMFREDELTVTDDVIDTARPLEESRNRAELRFDPGRQTGGPGAVVSTRAVGDRDVHGAPSLGALRSMTQRENECPLGAQSAVERASTVRTVSGVFSINAKKSARSESYESVTRTRDCEEKNCTLRGRTIWMRPM